MYVKVAGLTWNVRADDGDCEGRHLFGQTNFVKQEIKYAKMQEPDRLRQTVLHELVHVIIEAYAPPKVSNDEGLSEEIANAVGTGLGQVLGDNEELREYLLGKGGL